MTRATTALHEASHAAAALWLHKRVNYIACVATNQWADEPLAVCHIPLGEPPDKADLMVRLAGYASERRWQGWPPPWPAPKYETLEDIDYIVGRGGIDRAEYEKACHAVEELLSDRRFLRLRDALSRLLLRFHRLEAEDIEALAAVHDVPVPDQQPQEEPACST